MRAIELITESISGTDMLRIYKATHHGADSNPQMERWIERHDWGIKMLRPEQIPDENDPVYFNDPFGRVQDLDPERVRYFRIKLRNRAPVKPIIKGPGRSIIDGNHRAQAAKQLNMSIQAYVPMNVVSEEKRGVAENFADGKVKGKSRPGRVRRAGASCKGSVTALRAKAKKYGGEKGKMYHWCGNMKAGKKQ
jgi:hypothetical protein